MFFPLVMIQARYESLQLNLFLLLHTHEAPGPRIMLSKYRSLTLLLILVFGPFS